MQATVSEFQWGLVLVVMLLAYHFGYDKHGDREILDLHNYV